MKTPTVQGGQQSVPHLQIQPPSHPASKAICTRIKETAIWAWEASIQNLRTASAAIQRLLQRIIDAVHHFFAPKLESAKKAIQNYFGNTSPKPKEHRPISPPSLSQPKLEAQPIALPQQQAQPIPQQPQEPSSAPQTGAAPLPNPPEFSDPVLVRDPTPPPQKPKKKGWLTAVFG
jgi:hypothetical protein